MLDSQIPLLRDAVHGPVLLPGEPGFDDECRGFNLALAHRIDVAVGATCEADVQHAVRFATAHGLRVRVQATGHGMGAPADSGMLITTRRMRGVRVDPAVGTAVVDAGVRWCDVIEAAADHSLAALNGSSPDVGVVGYTLGGGLSPLGRAFGFAADRVRRLRLVDATGAVREIDADRHPEAFWGLRGGKCEIGVVTELEFDLLPLAEYYGGGIYYAGVHAPAVLRRFREWVQDLPEQACASIALLRLPDLDEVPPPLRGVLSVHLRFVYVGVAADGAAALAPMRAAAPALFDLVAVTPYRDIAQVHQDPVDPLPVWDAALLLHDLPADALEVVLNAAGPDAATPLTIVEIRHLGGALTRAGAHEAAIGGRDAAFSVGAIGICPPGVEQGVEAAGLSLLDAVAPWSSGGSNINFQGARNAPTDVRSAWPAATAARLARLKRDWDPDGRFRYAYSLDEDAVAAAS